MSELIDRQEAIDAFHTWFRDGFDEDRWWNSTHVLAAIEGLPSVQPDKTYEQGWKDGREALRKEMWEDGRDRLD